MNLSPNIENLSIWMQKEINKHKYADVSTIIRIHDGKISLIERTVAEKVKPTEIIGVSCEKRY